MHGRRWKSGTRTVVTERYLLDTGFLVAVVNRFDPWHARCVAASEGLAGSFTTVEGVLVEAAWMLRRVPRGPQQAIEAVLDSGARILPPTESRLRRVVALMNRYSDVPMDFVDAELVALAEEEDIPRVLTVDRRGFSTYWLHGKKRFTLLPDP
jgi:predicted nucleic acid-binding protein